MTGAIAAAFLAWGYVENRAADISVLLGDSAAHACRFLTLAFKRLFQLCAILIGFILGVIVEMRLHFGALQWHLITTILAILTGLSGAVVASAIYWLLITPSIAYRLQSSKLNLRWNDPARTPGIRALAEGYLSTSFFLALAAISAWLPPVLHHPLVSSVTVKYFLLFIFALNLWVGVGPQISIFLIVRRKKLQELDALDRKYADPDGIEETHKNLEKYQVYTASYASITSAPHLPYGTSVVVQFLVLLGTITSTYLPKIGH